MVEFWLVVSVLTNTPRPPDARPGMTLMTIPTLVLRVVVVTVLKLVTALRCGLMPWQLTMLQLLLVRLDGQNGSS